MSISFTVFQVRQSLVSSFSPSSDNLSRLSSSSSILYALFFKSDGLERYAAQQQSSSNDGRWSMVDCRVGPQEIGSKYQFKKKAWVVRNARADSTTPPHGQTSSFYYAVVIHTTLSTITSVSMLLC